MRRVRGARSAAPARPVRVRRPRRRPHGPRRPSRAPRAGTSRRRRTTVRPAPRSHCPRRPARAAGGGAWPPRVPRRRRRAGRTATGQVPRYGPRGPSGAGGYGRTGSAWRSRWPRAVLRRARPPARDRRARRAPRPHLTATGRRSCRRTRRAVLSIRAGRRRPSRRRGAAVGTAQPSVVSLVVVRGRGGTQSCGVRVGGRVYGVACMSSRAAVGHSSSRRPRWTTRRSSAPSPTTSTESAVMIVDRAAGVGSW